MEFDKLVMTQHQLGSFLSIWFCIISDMKSTYQKFELIINFYFIFFFIILQFFLHLLCFWIIEYTHWSIPICWNMTMYDLSCQQTVLTPVLWHGRSFSGFSSRLCYWSNSGLSSDHLRKISSTSIIWSIIFIIKRLPRWPRG